MKLTKISKLKASISKGVNGLFQKGTTALIKAKNTIHGTSVYERQLYIEQVLKRIEAGQTYDKAIAYLKKQGYEVTKEHLQMLIRDRIKKANEKWGQAAPNKSDPSEDVTNRQK